MHSTRQSELSRLSQDSGSFNDPFVGRENPHIDTGLEERRELENIVVNGVYYDRKNRFDFFPDDRLGEQWTQNIPVFANGFSGRLTVGCLKSDDPESHWRSFSYKAYYDKTQRELQILALQTGRPNEPVIFKLWQLDQSMFPSWEFEGNDSQALNAISFEPDEDPLRRFSQEQ